MASLVPNCLPPAPPSNSSCAKSLKIKKYRKQFIGKALMRREKRPVSCELATEC
jgi:hypothetical protein